MSQTVAEPESVSDLCYLDTKELGELKKLLWGIEQVCLRFIVPIDVANDREKREGRGMSDRFLRRVLGETNEATSQLELKKLFDKANTIVQSKWDSCSTGNDCLLELSGKQKEVIDFLETARMK